MSYFIIIYIIVTLPPSWDLQSVEDGKPVAMCMLDVAQGSLEYDEALKYFHQRIGAKVTVVKLQRIQNPNMYNIHEAFLESICKKYPGKKIDVKHLFHGSKEESIRLIATQGFNRNFASDANGILNTLIAIYVERIWWPVLKVSVLIPCSCMDANCS